ncbi:MAG: M48 family metalloprotease [Sulfolobales archaeon]
MMLDELYELAVPISLIFTLSLTFTITLSSAYYFYISGRMPERTVRYVAAASLFTLILMTIAISHYLSLYTLFTSPTVSIIWYPTLIFVVVVILCRSVLCRLSIMGLGKEVWEVVDGTPVYIYGGDGEVRDAHYDWLRGGVYFTKSYFSILTDDERMAVIYHKLGHVKDRFWMWVIYVLGVLWVFILPIIVSIVIFTSYSSLQQPSITKAVLPAILLTLLPMYAASIMVVQWIHEHEVDIYASRRVGMMPLVQAFLKLEVYTAMRGFEKMVESITFSKTFEESRISYFEILREVTLRCFKYMVGLFREVVERPFPESHPPLRLRINTIIVRACNPLKSEIR